MPGMNSSELIDLRVKCTNCQFLETSYCRSMRCVQCVVRKRPDSGCSGVSECRRNQVEQLNVCNIFRKNEWDL